MRVLILSCNTGEGHNSCAKAIKEYYDAAGVECVIEDSLRFISKSISKLISGGHVWIYRHTPGLFKFGYRCAKEHPIEVKEDSKLNRLLEESNERLYLFIRENRFDAVICTHVFAASMLTSILKSYPLHIVSSFVATDYTCSPGVKETELDCCFIPNKELTEDFICSNYTEEKLIASGIPVRQMFYRCLSREAAKEKLQIPVRQKHLLVMCGSMGCGPMEELTEKLAACAPLDWRITVVCGTNEKLRKKLVQKFAGESNVRIEGYVSDMSAFMDSADLCLTKPGGISVSEAAMKGLPMVFVNAVAGCEEYNHRFFTEKGCAESGSSVEELSAVCRKLMADDGARCTMQEKLKEIGYKNAAQVIYDYMNERARSLFSKKLCAGER